MGFRMDEEAPAVKPPAGFAEEMKQMVFGREIEEMAIKNREVYLWGPVDDDSAREIVRKILYFDSKSSDDITLYINSPGGAISSGMAIYDAMHFVNSDVRTVCMGQAASMGAVLLAAGAAGKRVCWPNARVMIHQPLISGNMYGSASDLEIQAEEMLRIRGLLNAILSNHSGKTVEEIESDTDRDNFMSAEEAKKYGLVDDVVSKADKKK